MGPSQKYWAMIPAAGIGTRMGMDTPKQYLKLCGKCILEYTLELFCMHERIEGVIVVLAENDTYWETLPAASNKKIQTTIGGVERCHSVQNGLKMLKDIASPDDWVMVHDAARPCLHIDDIDKLIQTMNAQSIGGILAIPVRDTMKRTGTINEVTETVSREGLWHALTPQMFQLSMLDSALEMAISNNVLVTDEAQAIEMTGERPVLVEGHPDNIKITHQSDLPLAELFLSRREVK